MGMPGAVSGTLQPFHVSYPNLHQGNRTQAPKQRLPHKPDQGRHCPLNGNKQHEDKGLTERNQMTQSHGTFFWAPLNKQLWFTTSKTELQAALRTRPGTWLKKDTPQKRSFTYANTKHLLAVTASFLPFSSSFTLRSQQSRIVLQNKGLSHQVLSPTSAFLTLGLTQDHLLKLHEHCNQHLLKLSKAQKKEQPFPAGFLTSCWIKIPSIQNQWETWGMPQSFLGALFHNSLVELWESQTRTKALQLAWAPHRKLTVLFIWIAK